MASDQATSRCVIHRPGPHQACWPAGRLGPGGMAELAQCFGVEKAALTGLMDRAERRGLAQRSALPGGGNGQMCTAPRAVGRVLGIRAFWRPRR